MIHEGFALAVPPPTRVWEFGVKRSFEQVRSFLTRAAMTESLEEREAVIAEVRRDTDFFEGYSPEETALLQDIWSDVVNGARETAVARSVVRQQARL